MCAETERVDRIANQPSEAKVFADIDSEMKMIVRKTASFHCDNAAILPGFDAVAISMRLRLQRKDSRHLQRRYVSVRCFKVLPPHRLHPKTSPCSSQLSRAAVFTKCTTRANGSPSSRRFGLQREGRQIYERLMRNQRHRYLSGRQCIPYARRGRSN